MLDKLIRFLLALSKLPGCKWATALIDGLRASQYRRHVIEAQVEIATKKAKNVKKTGGDLLGLKKKDGTGAGAPAGETKRPANAPREDERAAQTIIMPRPGGRLAAGLADAPASEAMGADSNAVTIRGSGLNALVDAATEAFCLAGRLRNTVAHADVEGLRASIAQKVADFDQRARAAGVPNEHVVAARYALCTLLDELALSTPWGAESLWSQHSLLSQFHGETWGGEKFFVMLERVVKEPARHLHLLEFMYLCLALGLQGKWRVLDGGRARLEAIEDNLYQTIRGARGEFERALSPRWQGVDQRANRLARFMPIWVLASLTGVVLLTAYLGFAWSLARVAEPVYERLARIGRDERMTAAVAPRKRTLTLREVLAPDIAAELLDVVEQARGSTIEIRGDGLFASGSAEIDPRRTPLIERIGDALNHFPGPVLVTGHTDSQAVALSRRARFPSNWELSQARAAAVSTVLGRRLNEPGRVEAEARGDTEPKAANDSPQGRAQNRRVEVTLLNAAGASPEHGAPITQTALPAKGRS